MLREKTTIQKLASESISNLTCMRAVAIEKWANTHNIELYKVGHILTLPKNLNKFVHDVSKNVYQELKGII